MATKKPGESQLGHKPFSKVKLEGPKVHHDDHGKDASVPGKGSRPFVPGEHWEMRYSTNEPSKVMREQQGSDFAPKRSSDRSTTYVKVNKEDH